MMVWYVRIRLERWCWKGPESSIAVWAVAFVLSRDIWRTTWDQLNVEQQKCNGPEWKGDSNSASFQL